MMDGIVDKLVTALLDWIFTLLYGLYVGILKIVDFISAFFDIFAGTSKVIYNGEADFLLNIFFAHDAVTNAFWAMTLIAIVLAFGFCIFSVSRKITDISGTVKQSVGQIMSQFVRCVLTLLLLNVMIVAAVNISNVLLDRINYAMINAEYLDEDEDGRTFTEQEYATMTKILATIGNYSVNPSADSRYNINSCFNAIRGDLQALQATGVFDYTYDKTASGHHTWQSALSMLARSTDLTRDLSLDVYDENVAQAILTISDELKNNPNFRPVETVSIPVLDSASADVDSLLFLITSMSAAYNEDYNNGSINDSLRNPYLLGEKDYADITQVKEDFNIQKFDYLVGYLAGALFIILMAICIFIFIVRMFNILLLYISAPLYVSSMPLDEGAKFQSWLQAFVIQLFSGFGHVIAMRLYLIIIPLVISEDLIFFAGDSFWTSMLNWFARLLIILGGAFAVLKGGSVVSSILSGNPGMQAAQQEARIGGMVTGGALAAVRGTGAIAKGIGSAVIKLPKGIQNVATAPARAINAAHEYKQGFKAPYQAIAERRRERKAAADKKKQAKSDTGRSARSGSGIQSDSASGSASAGSGSEGQNTGRSRAPGQSDSASGSASAGSGSEGQNTGRSRAPGQSDSASGSAPAGSGSEGQNTGRSRAPGQSDSASGGTPAGSGSEGQNTGRSRASNQSDSAASRTPGNVNVPDYPKPPPLSIWDKPANQSDRSQRRSTDKDSDGK